MFGFSFGSFSFPKLFNDQKSVFYKIFLILILVNIQPIYALVAPEPGKLALGITAFHKDKKRTRARLTEACKAIDGMFSGFAPDKRASARAMNGLAGMAAHKLIYAGIIIEEDGYI